MDEVGLAGATPRQVFVGRRRELHQVEACLDDVLAGRPHLILCHGEPGIGKTRLAQEFATRAARTGVWPVWGRSAPTEGAPPYWAWRQVLRATASWLDDDAPAAAGRATTDLTWPASEASPAPDPSASGESSQDRFRRFDAVGRTLRDLSVKRPIAVILDDAERGDEPSWLLLLHVVRMLTDERLALWVNCRDTRHDGSGVVAELLREPVTTRVRLGALSVPDVVELAGAAGHTLTAEEAADLHARTGGNAFFVTELSGAAGTRRLSGEVPETVREAISARVQRLSPACVRLLHAASILGREFPVATVAAMEGVAPVSCLEPCDEAARVGLLEADDTPAQYRFVHALVREAVEAGLGTAQRVRLHARAAEAIEASNRGRLDTVVFDLARHWAVAGVGGDPAIAAGWIRRAGDEAWRQLAFEEAARLFRLALHVGGAGLDDESRCDLLLSLGRAEHARADLDGWLAACLAAATVARRLGRADLVAQAALILEGVFAHPDLTLATIRLCREALDGLGREHACLRGRVLARLAGASMYVGDELTAGPASEEALALADGCPEPATKVAALTARHLACQAPDRVSERERLADRMLQAAGARPSPTTEMAAHLWRVDALLQRGDLAGAARTIDLIEPLARQVGGPWARWQLLRTQSVLAQGRARFAEARRLADEAFSAIARTGEPFAHLPRAAAMQNVGHHAGQDAGSLAAYGLVDATADPADFPTAGVMLTLAPAHLLVEAGRRAEAAALYRSLGPAAGWRPHPHAVLIAYAFGVGVATALDVPEDVATLHARLAGYRGHHVASSGGAMVYFGPVELWLGVAAEFLGRLDDAVADLERAVRACAVNRAFGFHAEAQYELAKTLARRAAPRDLLRARSLVADAARQAHELAMTPVAARADALLARLRAAGPAAGLTSREREVAGLVAQGLTNREIAARLYLSERTAQNHVQHILRKLDLANRSQIAVWMTERK